PRGKAFLGTVELDRGRGRTRFAASEYRLGACCGICKNGAGGAFVARRAAAGRGRPGCKVVGADRVPRAGRCEHRETGRAHASLTANSRGRAARSIRTRNVSNAHAQQSADWPSLFAKTFAFAY